MDMSDDLMPFSGFSSFLELPFVILSLVYDSTPVLRWKRNGFYLVCFMGSGDNGCTI